jgi:hypothetical protein
VINSIATTVKAMSAEDQQLFAAYAMLQLMPGKAHDLTGLSELMEGATGILSCVGD